MLNSVASQDFWTWEQFTAKKGVLQVIETLTPACVLFTRSEEGTKKRTAASPRGSIFYLKIMYALI